MNIEKDFVPYEESFELKELGFDEPCFGNWQDMKEETPWFSKSYTDNQNQYYGQLCSAPTFSQAFRWFREKYGYDCSFEDDMVEDEDDNEIQMWDFFIYKTKQKSDNKIMDFCSNNFETYVESYTKEDAEIACLKKLIEIVKQKQQ